MGGRPSLLCFYGAPVASNKCFNKSKTIVLQVTKRMGSLWLGRFDSLEDCLALGQEGLLGSGVGGIAHVEDKLCRPQPFYWVRSHN